MKSTTWLVGLVALVTSACGDITIGEEPSEGELGRAEFAWDVGAFGCLFGCDADDPMAVGAVALLVVVNDEGLPPFTVSSTDASVIEFTLSAPGSSYIEATAHREGRAKVILTEEGSGDVLDRLAVDAFDVASIEPKWPDEYDTRYTIMVGGEDQVEFTLRNSAGRELIGVGAVEYTFDGGVGSQPVDLTSALADYIVSMFTGSVTEYVEIEATEVGTGALVVTAVSGVSLQIPIDIVDGSAVTAIELEARSEPTERRSVIVDAAATAGSERVHSAECVWSFSPENAPLEIEWDARDTVQVAASAPTEVELTCEIGSVSGSIALVFE